MRILAENMSYSYIMLIEYIMYTMNLTINRKQINV